MRDLPIDPECFYGSDEFNELQRKRKEKREWLEEHQLQDDLLETYAMNRH